LIECALFFIKALCTSDSHFREKAKLFLGAHETV
jgi:hypothetical protein